MNAVPTQPLRLHIFSSPAHLPIVRAAAEKTCELLGFDDEVRGGIILSVDEALTNIIRHAYSGAPDRKIDVELIPIVEDANGAAPSGLKIVLRDFGRRVDPSAIKSRPLDEVRPGGLGVHIMNECMDTIEYRRSAGGGTELVMTKEIVHKESPKT